MLHLYRSHQSKYYGKLFAVIFMLLNRTSHQTRWKNSTTKRIREEVLQQTPIINEHDKGLNLPDTIIDGHTKSTDTAPKKFDTLNFNETQSTREMSEGDESLTLSVAPIGRFIGNVGNMFDVKALTRVTIERMAFFTDLTTDNVRYEVYVASGSYIGSKLERDHWSLVARGDVTGQGADKPTVIPSGHFQPVTIAPNEIKGFYITLTKDNLRYSIGTEVGQTAATNSELIMYQGSGVNTYPLSDNFHAPRIWNGALYYSLGFAPTIVEFDFISEFVSNVTDFDLVSAQIVSATDQSINDVLTRIISDDKSDIKSLVTKNELTLISVSSKMKKTEEEVPCEKSQANHQCSVLVSKVKVSHDDKVATGFVQNILYKHAQDLVNGAAFLTKYIGLKAESTKMVVFLTAGGTATTMGESSIDFFEKKVQEYLGKSMALKDPPIEISSVSVTYQEHVMGPITRKLKFRTRKYQVSGNLKDENEIGLYTLDVHTTITGEHKELSADVNFQTIVEESLASDMLSVVKDINKNKDFEFKVQKFSVANEETAEDIKQQREDNLNDKELTGIAAFFDDPANIGIVVGCGIGGLCIFASLLAFVLRKKTKASLELADEATGNTESTSFYSTGVEVRDASGNFSRQPSRRTSGFFDRGERGSESSFKESRRASRISTDEPRRSSGMSTRSSMSSSRNESRSTRSGINDPRRASGMSTMSIQSEDPNRNRRASAGGGTVSTMSMNSQGGRSRSSARQPSSHSVASRESRQSRTSRTSRASRASRATTRTSNLPNGKRSSSVPR